MSMSTARATVTDLAVVNDQRARDMAKEIAPMFPKDCTPAQALTVARIAVEFGLNPFLGELIPYQGRPYITYDGRIRLADQHPAYDGFEVVPATAAECRALGADDDQAVWKATVYRTDRRVPVTAYGRAGGKGERNPVANQWIGEVAYKRAVHRALRAAFPVPIPGLEEALSPAQLRAIHAADADLGIERDERHATLRETYGVESSAELTQEQAGAYLDARAMERSERPAYAADQLLDWIDSIDDRRDLPPVRAAIHDSGLADDPVLKNAYRQRWEQLTGKKAPAAPTRGTALELPTTDDIDDAADF